LDFLRRNIAQAGDIDRSVIQNNINELLENFLPIAGRTEVVWDIWEEKLRAGRFVIHLR
jgi:D-mannonate dehydratase